MQKNLIKNELEYKKALELLRFAWISSVSFAEIKKKEALLYLIEEYERGRRF